MNTKESNIKLSKPVEDQINEIKPIIDKLGRAYATGRRKTSVSRVWIKMVRKRFYLHNNTKVVK